MASDKKKRKAAKHQQPKPPAAGPVRHPDGDRRRKGLGQTVKEALEAKRRLRDGWPFPTDGPGS